LLVQGMGIDPPGRPRQLKIFAGDWKLKPTIPAGDWKKRKKRKAFQAADYHCLSLS